MFDLNFDLRLCSFNLTYDLHKNEPVENVLWLLDRSSKNTLFVLAALALLLKLKNRQNFRYAVGC